MDNPTPPHPFAKKRDIIIIAVLLVAAAGIFLFFRLTSSPASIAQITVMQADGSQQVYEIPLDKDQMYSVEGAALPVLLEIKDGRIRFVQSVCPDHKCEAFGWLQRESEWAACVPAGVWVRVIEPSS